MKFDFECTDVGNKDRFVEDHQGQLLFLREDRRWISWTGDRWSIEGARPFEKAEQSAKKIYDEARDCDQKERKRELSRWAHISQSQNKLRATINLAEEALTVSSNEFDNKHDVINCENGLLNLRTGVLTKHDAKQRTIKRANVSYMPDAQAPVWEKFLLDVFSEDQELVSWMQKALGYSLTGSVDEQVFFILYGRGENGKGKLCEALLRIMGDYALPAQFDTFLATDKSNVRALSAVGELKGVRFALASETESSKKWSEDLMKRLTGGDTLTGAKLYGNPYSFQPTHKLWFQANHLPSFKDGTHGFKRRVRVIPFERTFTGEAKDKDILDKLMDEKEGIFAWLVEGAKLYYRAGLGATPEACERATEQYIQDNDIVSRFIKDRLVKDQTKKLKVSDAYLSYVHWCSREGLEPTSMNFFPGNREERGIKKTRTKSGQEFKGYKLAEVCLWADEDTNEHEDKWQEELDRVEKLLAS